MHAVINKGTDQEISWDLDEYITPELVDSIKKAGIKKNIDWTISPLYDLLELLLEKTTREDLEERIYDEDPQIVEIIVSDLETYHFSTENIELQYKLELGRLYLPVLLVILSLFE